MLSAMHTVGREVPGIRADCGPPAGDRAIAALAASQYGVVARDQLRRAGLTDSAIGRRVEAGRLHRLHRGVYAVGHPVLGAYGRHMAAVLAGGPGAALSHASAAALWEIRATAAARIDVTVPRGGRQARPGLRIHRPRTLLPDEVTTHHGIPVTTTSRTILDLAAALTRRQLERALDQAEITGLFDLTSLGAVARAHAGHHGAGKLERALQAHTPGTTLTRSELEERMLHLCRAHDLPTPRVNATVAGLEVDFLYTAHRLVVETDGWRYHRTRRAFERDHERDATLARAGYRTLRFTHRQLAADPRTVARTLAAALRSSA